MIFADKHVEMIRNGLMHLAPGLIIKTQTRRVNRGIYQVGKDYAVQRKRGTPAEPDIRIVMDRVWFEIADKVEYKAANIFSDLSAHEEYWKIQHKTRFTIPVKQIPISIEDAHAEGGYTPEEYEKLFRKLNPKWNGKYRWAFEFHCVEVHQK